MAYAPLPQFQYPSNALLDFTPVNQGINALSAMWQNNRKKADFERLMSDPEAMRGLNPGLINVARAAEPDMGLNILAGGYKSKLDADANLAQAQALGQINLKNNMALAGYNKTADIEKAQTIARYNMELAQNERRSRYQELGLDVPQGTGPPSGFQPHQLQQRYGDPAGSSSPMPPMPMGSPSPGIAGSAPPLPPSRGPDGRPLQGMPAPYQPPQMQPQMQPPQLAPQPQAMARQPQQLVGPPPSQSQPAQVDMPDHMQPNISRYAMPPYMDDQRLAKIGAVAPELLKGMEATGAYQAHKKAAEENPANVQKSGEALMQAGDMKSRVQTMANLIDMGAKSGFGESWMQSARSLAETMGIEIKGAGPTGALQALSSGLILDAATKMKGALSDKDIAFLKQGSLTISTNPSAAKLMLPLMAQTAEKGEFIAQHMYQAYANNRVPNMVAINRDAQKLFPDPTGQFAKSAPPEAQASQAGPAAPAVPPAAQMQVVKRVSDALDSAPLGSRRDVNGESYVKTPNGWEPFSFSNGLATSPAAKLLGLGAFKKKAGE